MAALVAPAAAGISFGMLLRMSMRAGAGALTGESGKALKSAAESGASAVADDEDAKLRLALRLVSAAKASGRPVTLEQALAFVNDQWRKIDRDAIEMTLPRKTLDAMFSAFAPEGMRSMRTPDEMRRYANGMANVAWRLNMAPSEVQKEGLSLLAGKFPEGDSAVARELRLSKEAFTRAASSAQGSFPLLMQSFGDVDGDSRARAGTFRGMQSQVGEAGRQLERDVMEVPLSKMKGLVGTLRDGVKGVAAWMQKESTGPQAAQRIADKQAKGLPLAQQDLDALSTTIKDAQASRQKHQQYLDKLSARNVADRQKTAGALKKKDDEIAMYVALLGSAQSEYAQQEAQLIAQGGGNAAAQVGTPSAPDEPSQGRQRSERGPGRIADGRPSRHTAAGRGAAQAVSALAGLELDRRAASEVAPKNPIDEATESQNALKESLKQTTEQVHAQADALEAQAAAEGKSKSELRALTIAQLEKQRADLEATESVIPGYIQELEKRIDAEKRMLRLEQAGEEATATKKRKDELKAEADKRTKEEGDKADKVAGDIQGGFRKAFVDAVNGADNVLENLGKSLQKTLTNAVADALYDALLEEPIKKFSKELARAIRGLVGDKSGAAASGDGMGLSLEGVAAKIPGGGVEGGASGGAGGGFLSGIGDALSRMGGELWKTVASIGGTLKGALSGLLESFTKPSSGEGGSWFSAILGLLPFAKGGAFPAGTGLSAYASQIVDRPTLFPFAKGIGLMGEAGAEGILPLRRDAQGRLGVSASGVGMGGGGIVFSPTSVFHVDARSDRGAVIADMQRLLGNNNRAQMEHLQRLRVVPQS